MENSSSTKCSPSQSPQASPPPQSETKPAEKSPPNPRGRISSTPSRVRYFFQDLRRNSKGTLGHKKDQLVQMFGDCSRKMRRRNSEESEPFVDLNENKVACTYGTSEVARKSCEEEFAGKAKETSVVSDSRV